MFVDVLADILQKRASPYQQEPVLGHHAKHIRAEEDPPAEDRDHGQHAAHDHHPDGDPQIGIEVAHHALDEKGNPHHQAKLLRQHNPRPDVDLRVEIVKMNAQQNAAEHQEDAHQAAVVEQKNRGIDFQHQVGSQNKCRRDQQDLGSEKRQRANRDEDAKEANHSANRKGYIDVHIITGLSDLLL